ncbi:helix-turn-helix and ligand-binding sensor domain-containing protein [Polaribacter tangerinus]|uniref:helix-turn-helix and ligand-binding sensor domain-containing protein n=1 Tax=Polaribacter tangerinus TaxID=1920034 RepID=UPI000B4B3A0E|nr:triple tyrosine motif-containing protein [Polaribacter tangerinus]
MSSLKKSNTIYLLIFLIIHSATSYAQELPPIDVFTTEMYSGGNQNWSISQASNKYIYVANNKGLLEYNGAEWNLYPTPNETIMRSVKCIGDKIFTGFFRDFGYWKKNDVGFLVFHSIVSENSIEMFEDEQIWEIIKLEDWVLFKSLERIFLYNLNNKSLKVINGQNVITKIEKVNGVVYFQELGKGIFKIENGEPQLYSDNSILKNDKITSIFYKNDRLFFLTQKKGFFYFEDTLLKQWNILSNSYLKSKTIYSAKILSNGKIVLGSISNGLIGLTENGEIDYVVNQNFGLSNNTILSIFEDVDSNIWLGLDNGINLLNFKSAFKFLVNQNKFLGTVYSSIIYNNYLYIGTNQGLFYKSYNSNEDFKFLDKTQGQVWSLRNIDGTLFCGHDSGTFIIKNNKAQLISKNQGTWDFKKINSQTILQGNYDGLYVLHLKNNQWKVRNKVEGFKNSSRYFILDNNNKVFVNHEYKGVFKLELNESYTKVLKVEKDSSVNKGIHSSLVKYIGNILYASKNGVFRYDDLSNGFKLDSVYTNLIPINSFTSAKLVVNKTSNKLWAFNKEGLKFISPGKLSSQPVLRSVFIKNTLLKGASGFENITHLENEKYIIGITNGYAILDLNKLSLPNQFEVAINKVSNFQLEKPLKNIPLNSEPTFNSKENSIEFTFSVPNYSKELLNLYQYKLDGYTTKWSDFQQSNTVFYENLPYGDFTFNVRAKIGSSLSSNIAAFSFTINKPWFLSGVALFIYFLIFSCLMYIWYLFSKRYHNKQKKKLLEDAQKELELRELENSQKIIKLNNEKLRVDIESKNRELASSTMNIIKKNDFLNTIKSELLQGGEKRIAKVVKIIDKNLNNTDDWKMFQEAFNNADKKFLKKMKSKHPDLTPNDLRLCAYLRLNLSSKEIAPLLNISPRSVEVKRYRLRKKMNLAHDENLTSYILEI